MSGSQRRRVRYCLALAVVLVLGAGAVAAGGLTYEDAARIKTVTSAKISPDGKHLAYLLSVPRIPYEDEDGGPWVELWIADAAGRARPFVTGKVNLSAIDWTPDGSGVAFLAKRGEDEKTALYVIPINGGEAQHKATHDSDITAYGFSPDGKRVAFLAKPPEDKLKEKLEKKGFKAEVYEEEWRPVQVWLAALDADPDAAEPQAMDLPGSASELHWSPDGSRLALALAPTALIDDRYMKRKVHVVEVDGAEIVTTIDNPGKLGKVAWSPDGRHLAMIAAQDLNDPNPGRLMIASAGGGELKNLLPDDYEGDVVDFAWQDDGTLTYIAHQGAQSLLATIGADGSGRATLVPTGGPILRELSLSVDGKTTALLADTPEHPTELHVMRRDDDRPVRWTDSNPWLGEIRLAKQEVMTYRARDGLEIEGVLIRPLDEKPGQRYPLILVVHGGPEAHFSNGWLTGYSRPGQFGAAAGFAIFYQNYRGSTGRGVAFSKLDQADYAGAEFNDLVDGITYLAGTGLVDEKKVGVTGGSYGGFASAWCATALTEHFAAAVMFVGISDQISKFGTTDIPNEMYDVHARRWPWDYWDWYRERSPVYHTPSARTPILILHGKDDTRVHPSQSMILYRYLKTLGNVPVRLVLYPGEGHGNRKAAARLDYSMRLMRWMDHYLKGPAGDPPPYALEHDEAKLDSGEEEDDDDEEGEE